ncbi:DUF1648 domain-containing protein [Corynebacterium aquilae]|uniref:DUF1648 domain-containing protein n=1 Tax=Corynebacterium aquilae DSM 44791 TaxID=1431546 RepID=A0A1L7CI69_9CORY|nr:DUF1648 domain-containing protein [Corynebacterium aquilae]APT85556.1 hypothetical protein CAQU_11425 [Corynebacterium aquilae DSM 44791]
MLSFVLIAELSLLTSTLILLMLGRFRQQRTPYGVPIPKSKVDDPAIAAAARRYRLIVGGAGLVTCVVAAIPPASHTVWPLLLGSFALSIASIIGWKQAASHIRRQGWTVPKQGMVGNVAGTSLNQITPGTISWAPHIMALVVIVATTLMLIAQWSQIPDTFATHFSTSGEPNGFTDKGPGVFFAQFMGFGVTALSLGMSWMQTAGLAYTRSTKGAKDRARLQAMMQASEKGSAWLMCSLSALVAVLGLALALPDTTPLPPGNSNVWVALFVIVGIIGSLAMVAWIMISGERSAGLAEPDLDEPDEQVTFDRTPYLKWGLFYYNPDDPALFVEKTIGMGIDFNYAHWPAKVFGVVIVCLLLAPLSLALL